MLHIQTQHPDAAPSQSAMRCTIAPTKMFTREELDAMNFLQLLKVKQKLGLQSLGVLSKEDLIQAALEAQNAAPPPLFPKLFTKEDLAEMSISELMCCAEKLGIEDTEELPREELEDFVLALQMSLSEDHQVTTTDATTRPSSSAAFPTAATAPTSKQTIPPPTLPDPQPEPQGITECKLCCLPMGGNAPMPMAVIPCGHSYCMDCLLEVAQKAHSKCP